MGIARRRAGAARRAGHCEDGPDCRIPNAGLGAGEFRDQRGLAIDGQGNLHVADTGYDRVQRRIVVEVENPPNER